MQDLHHGQEIYLFFGIYGIQGIIGIVISQLIIGLVIYKVLTISINNKIENYDELLKHINKNHKIREIIKIIINIFLLLSFYVMIAGFSAYFSQELGIPNIIGATIVTIFCYITFMGNIERLVQVNTLLIPILVIFIIILTSKNLDAYTQLPKLDVHYSIYQVILSAVLYASYNSITLIPIIITLKKYIKKKKQMIKTSILCVIILIILAMAIYGLILKIDININEIELPTVYVAGQMGHIYKYIYGIIILVAIFTSSISAGYGILENYIKKPKKYKAITIMICLSSILISNIGFSNLINLLYPIFGFLGIVQICLIFACKRLNVKVNSTFD